MNKNYIYIICLAYSFVMNGMHGETDVERAALRQRIEATAAEFRKHHGAALPTFNNVFVTEIDNDLNKKITIDIGYQGQSAYAGDELQANGKMNIRIPLTHKGAYGFPVISISIEGSDKVLTYRPSGSTPKVKLKVTDENGEFELLKYKDEE